MVVGLTVRCPPSSTDGCSRSNFCAPEICQASEALILDGRSRDHLPTAESEYPFSDVRRRIHSTDTSAYNQHLDLLSPPRLESANESTLPPSRSRTPRSRSMPRSSLVTGRTVSFVHPVYDASQQSRSSTQRNRARGLCGRRLARPGAFGAPRVPAVVTMPPLLASMFHPSHLLSILCARFSTRPTLFVQFDLLFCVPARLPTSLPASLLVINDVRSRCIRQQRPGRQVAISRCCGNSPPKGDG